MVIKLQAGDFYGVTAKSVNLAGFRFTEKSYEPQSDLPRHAHELAHFVSFWQAATQKNLAAGVRSAHQQRLSSIRRICLTPRNIIIEGVIF
jgi:hypothetical protein